MRGKKNPLQQTSRTAMPAKEQEAFIFSARQNQIKQLLEKELLTITVKKIEQLKRNKLLTPAVTTQIIEKIQKKPTILRTNPILIFLFKPAQLIEIASSNQTSGELLNVLSEIKLPDAQRYNIYKAVLGNNKTKDSTVLRLLSLHGKRDFNISGNDGLWLAASNRPNVSERILVKSIDYILGQTSIPKQDADNLSAHGEQELEYFLKTIARHGASSERVAKKLLASSGKMPRRIWTDIAYNLECNYLLPSDLRAKVKARYAPKPNRARAYNKNGIPRGMGIKNLNRRPRW